MHDPRVPAYIVDTFRPVWTVNTSEPRWLVALVFLMLHEMRVMLVSLATAWTNVQLRVGERRVDAVGATEARSRRGRWIRDEREIVHVQRF